MSGSNGQAQPHSDSSPGLGLTPSYFAADASGNGLPAARIKQLITDLEVPFDISCIEWRVTHTWNEGARGQIVPYADPRAYTDRLNALLTPAGWTRKYTVTTSANFERANDKKVVAKVLVTCELTIFGLGSHSATGEEWADNEYACTAAEAQSFKRAASCFGLGRYLYYFTGVWVDLDDRKRPKQIPQLFDWATPQGWRKGMRPSCFADYDTGNDRPNDSKESNPSDERQAEELGLLHKQIEEFAGALGSRLYRDVLKTEARIWNPSEVCDVAILRRVLSRMSEAKEESARLRKALNSAKPGTLTRVLRAFHLGSIEQIHQLETLKKIVQAVEQSEGYVP